MTLGGWTIRRPRRADALSCTALDPYRRGLVIEWLAPDDRRVASFPVPHYGYAWAWPWILYRSIRAVQELRAAFWTKMWVPIND